MGIVFFVIIGIIAYISTGAIIARIGFKHDMLSINKNTKKVKNYQLSERDMWLAIFSWPYIGVRLILNVCKKKG